MTEFKYFAFFHDTAFSSREIIEAFQSKQEVNIVCAYFKSINSQTIEYTSATKVDFEFFGSEHEGKLLGKRYFKTRRLYG